MPNLPFIETLKQAKEIFTWSQQQDVTGLQHFFFYEAHKPLIATGAGGSFSPMSFAALLYSTCQGLGRAVTPLTYASFSDAVIQHSKTLILSSSGHGVDIDPLISRTVKKLNPEYTAAITHEGSRNDLHKALSEVSKNSFVYDWNEPKGFISTTAPFAVFGLLYKAFTSDHDFANQLACDLEPEKNFTYAPLSAFRTKTVTEEQPVALKPFSEIKNYIVLYGGWGEPVAQDFESKMIESGYASVQLCDYRDFMYGRFIFLSNHMEESVLVLLMTPRERQNFVDRAIFNGRANRGKDDLFPDQTPVITVETAFDSPLAALDLLYKSSVLFSGIGESFGYDPCNPKNYSKISKQDPKSIPFTGIKGNSHGLEGVEPV